jgi:hypothetical protein
VLPFHGWLTSPPASPHRIRTIRVFQANDSHGERGLYSFRTRGRSWWKRIDRRVAPVRVCHPSRPSTPVRDGRAAAAGMQLAIATIQSWRVR